jgi:hypothetical protein
VAVESVQTQILDQETTEQTQHLTDLPLEAAEVAVATLKVTDLYQVMMEFVAVMAVPEVLAVAVLALTLALVTVTDLVDLQIR